MADMLAAQFSVSVQDRPKILLIGDSLTQQSFSTTNHGWGASLQDWYVRNADIVNRGLSGYNSRWVLQLMPKILPVDSPVGTYMFATILLGANDAVSDRDPQHVPLVEYKENIKGILEYLRSVSPHMLIILITPFTVDHIQWPNRHHNQVKLYASVVRDLAAEYGTSILDFWSLSDECSIELADLNDGLHCAASGNQKIFKGLQAIIRSTHAHLAPDFDESGVCNLPFHFPNWRELKGKSEAEVEAILTEWHW